MPCFSQIYKSLGTVCFYNGHCMGTVWALYGHCLGPLWTWCRWMVLSGTWRSSRKILFTYVALKKRLPTSANKICRMPSSCFAATSRGRPPAVRSSRPSHSGASLNCCKILSTVCMEADVPSFFFTTLAISALSASLSRANYPVLG